MATGFDDEWLDDEELVPAPAPEAPRMYGLRPGTFARLLTVRGVDAALYGKRRAG